MKVIEIVTAEHPRYREVCQFANDVYRETIGAQIRTTLPDTLIAATEGQQICGCIGFNHQVSTSLFLNDERYQEAIRYFPPGTKIAEHNTLAVRHFPAGISLLIAAFIAYARSLCIHKVAFAGIDASYKSVVRLGIDVQVLGPTRLECFPKEEQEMYRHWHTLYKPTSCILDTAGVETAYAQTVNRFARKAYVKPSLQPAALQHAC